TVTVQDIFGNTVTSSSAVISLAIGTNPSGGVLSGAATVTAVNGVATFSNLSINRAGSGYTLTASSGGLTGATSTSFSITAGTASQLVVSAPATATAGVSLSVTVTAQDVFANTATAYTGTVHFTSTDGQVSLPTDYTFLAADNGTHTFTNAVTLRIAGSQ